MNGVYAENRTRQGKSVLAWLKYGSIVVVSSGPLPLAEILALPRFINNYLPQR